MTLEDNLALVRRFYDEVYNQGNVGFADEAHGPGYRYHDITNRATLHATHTGKLGDIAPTGKPVRLASVIIYRFAADEIVEEWEIFDALGMYRQLGVKPPDS